MGTGAGAGAGEQILPTFFFLGRTVLQLLGPTVLLLEFALAVASAGDVQLFSSPAAPPAPLSERDGGVPVSSHVALLVVFDAAFFRPVLGFLAWYCCLAMTAVTTGNLLAQRATRRG